MAKAGEEQNTQQPTGGKGTGFHTKKQNISKGKFPIQNMKTMDAAGPSIASKKRKRGRPSSGVSEQDKKRKHNQDCQRYRKNKKDEILRLQNIEKQQNHFFEKFKISSFEHLEDEFSKLQQTEIKLKTTCEKALNALCEKFGVAQQGLQDKEKRSFCKELDKMVKILEDETIEELSNEDNEKLKRILKEFIVLLDGPVPRGEEAARNEHINQHAEIG